MLSPLFVHCSKSIQYHLRVEFMCYWFIEEMAITWRKEIRMSLPSDVLKCLINRILFLLAHLSRLRFLLLSLLCFLSGLSTKQNRKRNFETIKSLSDDQKHDKHTKVRKLFYSFFLSPLVVLRMNYNRFSSLFISFSLHQSRQSLLSFFFCFCF